jgi:Zinc knuckle
MAASEPSEKHPPQKCSNCGGEGHTARTCTKGGSTHVRSDTLPPTTTLQVERGRGNSGVLGPAGAHQVIGKRRIRENPGVNAGVFAIAHCLGSLSPAQMRGLSLARLQRDRIRQAARVRGTYAAAIVFHRVSFELAVASDFAASPELAMLQSSKWEDISTAARCSQCSA